jgi:hypothetical protein
MRRPRRGGGPIVVVLPAGRNRPISTAPHHRVHLRRLLATPGPCRRVLQEAPNVRGSPPAFDCAALTGLATTCHRASSSTRHIGTVHTTASGPIEFRHLGAVGSLNDGLNERVSWADFWLWELRSASHSAVLGLLARESTARSCLYSSPRVPQPQCQCRPGPNSASRYPRRLERPPKAGLSTTGP